MYIITIDKFEGDMMEKNEKRICTIKNIGKDELKLGEMIESFENAILSNDIDKVHYIVENELFFEVLPRYIICEYIDKIKKVENWKEKLTTAYVKYGKNGFERMINRMIRS